MGDGVRTEAERETGGRWDGGGRGDASCHESNTAVPGVFVTNSFRKWHEN